MLRICSSLLAIFLAAGLAGCPNHPRPPELPTELPPNAAVEITTKLDRETAR